MPVSYIAEIFGMNVHALREANKWELGALADKTKALYDSDVEHKHDYRPFNAAEIDAIEKGEKHPGHKVIETLRSVFKVDAPVLFLVPEAPAPV